MSSTALNVGSKQGRFRTSVTRLVRNSVQAVTVWGRRRLTINELMALDDHTLKDIGLHRSEIPSVAHHLPAAAIRSPRAKAMQGAGHAIRRDVRIR